LPRCGPRPARRRRRCVVIYPPFNRRLSCRLHHCFQPQNRLRQKANFSPSFNPMTPVQISREKYSALDSPQISGFISLSRLVQRGVSRSSRTWRRGAVAASDRSILWNADERSPRGRPSRVVLGAPTLALSSRSAQCAPWGDGGKRARSPGRARRKPLKPLRREGRVSSAEPVVLPRAFFTARGPWAPAGARSSLRPLTPGGSRLRKARTPSAPREREASAV
jgi:hypothetical protein